MEQVTECHHVAGDDDYLLKVRCRGTHDLDHLLATELKDKLGVARTRTTIVLSTAKESVHVPIPCRGLRGKVSINLTNFEQMLGIAIDEARQGLAEGGIPIGAALFDSAGTL